MVVPNDGRQKAGEPLLEGGSGTEFSLTLPAGAACTGDSANDGFRVQSYMVPAEVDSATLTFGSDGPLPFGTGAAFRQPLYRVDSSPFLEAQTANATDTGGPGPVINIPAFSLAVYAAGDIPAGNYRVGIACTKGPASATQLDRYWEGTMVVTADATDKPAGVKWTATASGSTAPTPTTAPDAGGGATTTPTSTPAPPSGSPTSPTSGTDGSSTPVAGGSTPTGSPPSSSGGAVSGGQSESAFGAAPASGSSPLPQLPVTGASTTALGIWGACLLISGRIAVLLGKTPSVIAAL